MQADPLSVTFAALADPTRRAILAQLAQKECTVKEIAEPFSITLPAITKHLKVLESAGLIEKSRQAQFRPCRIKPARLKEVADFLESYRQFWEASFDRLESLLQAAQSEDNSNGSIQT